MTPGPFHRPPDQVMRLARMGSAHPSRLSFLRVLLRRMRAEGWRFDRPVWEVDAQGVGRAVYRAICPVQGGSDQTYSLVAFAHDLPADQRSDRVIATAWDATFTLVAGEVSPDDLDRLAANVPLQEAGRIGPRELTLARANRSVRLFAHVVDRLAQGQQPDADQIAEIGYLMRTTAVYGSGKFGAADRDARGKGPGNARAVSGGNADGLADPRLHRRSRRTSGPRAGAARGRSPWTPALNRRLGVGNSTGLGMAPFLIRHPVLLNNWMMAREEALARVRALIEATPEAQAAFREGVAAATQNADTWHSSPPDCRWRNWPT